MGSDNKKQLYEMSIEEGLTLLADLLKREREALLSGDAGAVTAMTADKLHICEKLEQCDKMPKGDIPMRSDLAALAKNVGALTLSNHKLLEQMNSHYNGMLELFLRLAGQTSTYGPDGAVREAPTRLSLKSTRITA